MSYRDTDVRTALEQMANGVATLEGAETHADVTAALRTLRADEQQALWLWGQGYSRKEVAQTVLGSPFRSTGKALVDRAFTHLMEKINHG